MTEPRDAFSSMFTEVMEGEPQTAHRDEQGRYVAAAEPTPDPAPRLPAPNPAQGASGRAAPTPPDPREEFMTAIQDAIVLSRGKKA